eukprot:COSAG04_NODE_897_length_9581_cov_96.260599_12_plen_112_part_00
MWAGAHPPLSAVVHSGDGASPTAVGESSRDLAAAALYDAGLLRSPGEDEDKAKATGVLLVSAAAMATTTAVRQPCRNGPRDLMTLLHSRPVNHSNLPRRHGLNDHLWSCQL